jgi:sugar phosphate permease
LALIVAGESVFFLPFVIARVFRPTMLEVFGLTNLQLGTAMSVYGVIAMISYFPGGPLADRFPARKLISIALVATALGGIVLSLVPSLTVLKVLFGWWGVTTILLSVLPWCVSSLLCLPLPGSRVGKHSILALSVAGK